MRDEADEPESDFDKLVASIGDASGPASDFIGSTEATSEWLVPGVIPIGVTVLIGARSTGKTFLGLNLAGALVAGKSWLGIPFPSERVCPGSEPKQGKSVTYIYAEGVQGLTKRLDVLTTQFLSARLKGLHLVRHPIRFTDAQHVAALIKALERDEHRPDVIIVDTYGACVDGRPMNDDATVGAFLRGLTELRDYGGGSGVSAILIHHPLDSGPASGPRGSKTLGDRADAMLSLTETGRTADGGVRLTLECEKPPRDSEPFQPIHMVRRTVDVCTAPGEKQATSCIIEVFDSDAGADLTAADVSSPARALPRGGANNAAKLLAALTKAGGEVPSASEWQRLSGVPAGSFHAAKNKLGVRVVADGAGFRLVAKAA